MPNDFLAPISTALALTVGGTLSAWFLARAHSGRFARTIEQARQLVDFAEQWSKAHTALQGLPPALQEAAERLLTAAVNSVDADFQAERATLPQFSARIAVVRRWFLLRLPKRLLLWPPQLVFHASLIFVLVVVTLRLTHAGHWDWRSQDAVALSAALGTASLARVITRALDG
jgi:hypothetical protein